MPPQLVYRWHCQTCELVAPWTTDPKLSDKEAAAHTKKSGHATSSFVADRDRVGSVGEVRD